MAKNADFNDADVTFVTDMIPHHEAAIEMAETVIEDGENDKVAAIAENIVEAQAAEIEALETWLDERGLDRPKKKKPMARSMTMASAASSPGMAKNEILIYGSIGSSWWDEDYVTSTQVRAELAGMTGDITVRINSGGGIASEGQAIYTALKDYDGKVTVIIDSVAASAASLIAMAGDEIVLRLGAWMLIHDPATPWTMGRGTEEDHLKEARLLSVIGNAYADIYAARAGLSRDEARETMKAETYLDGQMAVDMGFATSVDTTSDAVPAARFDYRIYAHAPATLRAASKDFGRVPEKEAVMAMIAGRARMAPGTTKGGPVMAAKKGPAAPTAADEDLTVDEDAMVETEENGEVPAGDTAPVAALAADRVRAQRILELATMGNMPAEFAQDHITRGTAADAVLDLVMAKRRENADMDSPMAGRPTARILRDERDTKRAGIAAALTAQMARTAPSDDRARPFMNLSVVEMAANCIDHRGSLRTANDRLDVIQMAMHSTSDFPIILENALNKRLDDSYQLAAPTYRRVAMAMDFADFRPHPVARLSDFPMLKQVNEAGEIQFGTLSEKKESVAVLPYASGLTLTRQLLINDDLGAIDRMVSNAGLTVAAFEDATFWAMALGGASSNGPTMLETTRQMFNATDGSLAGTPAAISVASLSLGRAALRKRKRLDGTDLDVVAAILLVGPDKETEAQQVVAPLQAQQAGNVNPFSGTLSVVVTAKITGNAWYLFAAPEMLANFSYGYLQGAAGPRIRMEEPFGRQGVSFTVEEDFGCGAIDWRGGFRNAGA